VVEGGNVLHRIKREGNCPWGAMSGGICPGGLPGSLWNSLPASVRTAPLYSSPFDAS